MDPPIAGDVPPAGGVACALAQITGVCIWEQTGGVRGVRCKLCANPFGCRQNRAGQVSRARRSSYNNCACKVGVHGTPGAELAAGVGLSRRCHERLHTAPVLVAFWGMDVTKLVR